MPDILAVERLEGQLGVFWVGCDPEQPTLLCATRVRRFPKDPTLKCATPQPPPRGAGHYRVLPAVAGAPWGPWQNWLSLGDCLHFCVLPDRLTHRSTYTFVCYPIGWLTGQPTLCATRVISLQLRALFAMQGVHRHSSDILAVPESSWVQRLSYLTAREWSAEKLQLSFSSRVPEGAWLEEGEWSAKKSQLSFTEVEELPWLPPRHRGCQVEHLLFRGVSRSRGVLPVYRRNQTCWVLDLREDVQGGGVLPV